MVVWSPEWHCLKGVPPARSSSNARGTRKGHRFQAVSLTIVVTAIGNPVHKTVTPNGRHLSRVRRHRTSFVGHEARTRRTRERCLPRSCRAPPLRWALTTIWQFPLERRSTYITLALWPVNPPHSTCPVDQRPGAASAARSHRPAAPRTRGGTRGEGAEAPEEANSHLRRSISSRSTLWRQAKETGVLDSPRWGSRDIGAPGTARAGSEAGPRHGDHPSRRGAESGAARPAALIKAGRPGSSVAQAHCTAPAPVRRTPLLAPAAALLYPFAPTGPLNPPVSGW
jgi:hypothetical protein